MCRIKHLAKKIFGLAIWRMFYSLPCQFVKERELSIWRKVYKAGNGQKSNKSCQRGKTFYTINCQYMCLSALFVVYAHCIACTCICMWKEGHFKTSLRGEQGNLLLLTNSALHCTYSKYSHDFVWQNYIKQVMCFVRVILYRLSVLEFDWLAVVEFDRVPVAAVCV